MFDVFLLLPLYTTTTTTSREEKKKSKKFSPSSPESDFEFSLFVCIYQTSPEMKTVLSILTHHHVCCLPVSPTLLTIQLSFHNFTAKHFLFSVPNVLFSAHSLHSLSLSTSRRETFSLSLLRKRFHMTC